jgi:hypothetical protein
MQVSSWAIFHEAGALVITASVSILRCASAVEAEMTGRIGF